MSIVLCNLNFVLDTTGIGVRKFTDLVAKERRAVELQISPVGVPQLTKESSVINSDNR